MLTLNLFVVLLVWRNWIHISDFVWSVWLVCLILVPTRSWFCFTYFEFRSFSTCCWVFCNMDPNPRESESGSVKGVGSISSSDMIFRADKIDLKSIDLKLEQHLSRVWSRNLETQNSQKPREVWEIDPSKLEIRYLVAQGTYGIVYRGTYDGQDVAGTLVQSSCLKAIWCSFLWQYMFDFLWNYRICSDWIGIILSQLVMQLYLFLSVW